jgi:DNA polymerase III subunit gamma/tau
VRFRDVTDMLGLVGRDQVGAVMDALAVGDARRLLELTAELAEQAVDFQDLLAEIIAALHRIAVEQALAGQGDAGAGQSGLTPEAVQLYYQIALMGYRDLQFAPDLRSGLEMTLLRMLAFAPDDAQAQRVPPAAGTAGGAAPTESADRAGSAPPPGSGNEPAAASVVPVAPSNEAEPMEVGIIWHELAARLELGGVARMIADHADLVDTRDGIFRLLLDPAHDTLLSDAPVAAIQRAVRAAGLDVRVTVDVGPVAGETPAQRLQRLRRQRQQAAEETLATDVHVQTLLSEFGGRIDGVSPIE